MVPPLPAWAFPPASPPPAVPRRCRRRAGRPAAGPQIPGASAQARGSPSRSSSIRAAGGNQRPVRVTAAGIAGEGPDIGDLGDMVGIAVDDPALGIASHVHLLRGELHGDEGRLLAQIGLDDFCRGNADQRGLPGLIGIVALLYGRSEEHTYELQSL